MTADLHRADDILHQLAVQVCIGASLLSVELEGNMNIGHLSAQLVFVDAAISGKQPMTKGKQRNTAIHGTRIYIYIAHFASQIFGHGALAAR